MEEALAGTGQDTIGDKMVRYEGHQGRSAVERLVGLRRGERSQGLSTGVIDAELVMMEPAQNDTDDEDDQPRSSLGRENAVARPTAPDNKKKIKVTDEYVCTDCGTRESPEWRKGPSGPKTLCNACGLRWAKREKKRRASGTAS